MKLVALDDNLAKYWLPDKAVQLSYHKSCPQGVLTLKCLNIVSLTKVVSCCDGFKLSSVSK